MRYLLLAIIVATAAACATGVALTESDADTVLAHQVLGAPNPALPGPYAVAKLYYGSGEDDRRAEFRDSVAIRTDSVDASKLVSLGGSADMRNKYWGFKPEAFPVNGRVWYPAVEPGHSVLDPVAVAETDVLLPIVLIVHGNHNMREYSDPGYGYLGELLASRGFVTVSVDENFLNGGIRAENDARGWMLLKHLQAWRAFASDTTNLFFERVDLDNVAVVGHSRGGEAVAVASAFNTLSRYPDDASLEFDFGFGIQAAIAIAPVDGQYLPTGRYTPLKDVNYLVFHGSHDGDVSSFHGLRQYQRIEWSQPSDRFKAAVYMYRANHGQWNTVWNNKDGGPRSGRFLDLGVLVEPEAQREFGKLYISSFLEATLHRDERYLPVFRDHRVIGGWLPESMYISRFQSSAFRPLATFEEDIDLTTGTASGVALSADSMAKWSEKRIDLRSQNRSSTSGSQVNQGLWLGWNNTYAKSDSIGVPAVFDVILPEGLTAGWGVDPAWTLDFQMTGTEGAPGPRSIPVDSTATDSTAVNAATDSTAVNTATDATAVNTSPGEGDQDSPAADAVAEENEEDDDEDEDPDPIDLSLEVEDAFGASARVRVGRYGPIRRPLKISILRRKDLESNQSGADHELVLQSYSVPLADFVRLNPNLAVGAIKSIRFVFDRLQKGSVILDDIGLTDMPPGFLGARVPDAGADADLGQEEKSAESTDS